MVLGPLHIQINLKKSNMFNSPSAGSPAGKGYADAEAPIKGEIPARVNHVNRCPLHLIFKQVVWHKFAYIRQVGKKPGPFHDLIAVLLLCVLPESRRLG